MRSMKISFAAIVLMSLTACGGGGGGSSDSGGGNGGGGGGSKVPAIPLVSGEFKSSLTTGQKFPNGMTHLGACDNGNAYDRYYESEQVLVFSNSNKATDSDYEYIASSIQNQFEDVLSDMSLTLQQFRDLRPAYTPNGVKEIIGINNDAAKKIPEAVTLFNHPDYETSYSHVQTLMRKSAFFKMNREQQQNLVKAYDGLFYVDMSSMAMPEKLVVCIDDKRLNQAGYGEGTMGGMEIAALSLNSRSDINQIIRHELVHTIQGNVAAPYGEINSYDRWFLEGQAVVLSGQKIASKPDGFNPTSSVTYADEPPSEMDKYYEHYGLAYSFLAKHNSPSDFHNMFLGLRYSIQHVDNFWRDTSPKFATEFENSMKVNGLPITLDDFKTHYLELVK